MLPQFLVPYLVMAFGIFLAALAFVPFRAATIGRLQEAKYLPIKKKLKPKYREVLYGAGQNLSLFILGALIFVLGVILFIAK